MPSYLEDDPEETTRGLPASDGGAALQLRILAGEHALTVPLPASGSVTIGRSAQADVRIDDPSISRRHATLHVGASLVIEDHGGRNGTRVAGRAVAFGESCRLQPGDAIELGAVLLVVQRRPPDERRAEPRPVAGSEMAALRERVAKIAAGQINVLILGETGVGKEVLAAFIHRRSPRADAPFVGLNCAAFSGALLESELFGHERGAFTGADHAKPGLLETANGGTLFLDELGELPLALQAKLLRVIEQREVLRVGALKPRKIDVRIVAATNRDLERAVAEERFRQDLFFRLNGFAVTIPPLRERVSEIAGLAATFVEEACRLSQRGRAPRITDEAMALLERYPWPGNIRELRNVMERAALLCDGEAIRPDDLPLERMKIAPPPSPAAPAPVAGRLPDQMEQLERRRILDALAECGGNQSEAARLLGISRNTLISRLDDYGVSRPRKRRDGR